MIIDNGGPMFDETGGAFCWPAAVGSWIWAFVYGQWKLGLLGLVALLVLSLVMGPLVILAHLAFGAAYGLIGYNAASVANPGRWDSFSSMKRSMQPWIILVWVFLGGGLLLGIAAGLGLG